MASIKTNSIQQLICSLFIFLFVYTALSKFYSFDRFLIVLAKSPLIGNSNHLVAWSIPFSELAIALLLLLPSTRRIGMYGAFVLMILFTAYVGYMVVFIPHLPCSCGGVIQKMSWKQHLFFNAAFTGLALWGIRLLKKEEHEQAPEKQRIVFS
jgi:uncharacterized membrane protein